MNNLDIFLVNSDNPHTKSLCKKLAENVRDGAIIPLNTQEMDLYCSADFQHFNYGDTENTLVQVYPGSSYIFVAGPDVEIDDIIKAGKRLEIEIGIIRTRD